MSLSKKKAVKYVIIGIMAVSLFAAFVFYTGPNNSHAGPIVFALAASNSQSPDTVYSMGFFLNVTLLNGTSLENPSELNSTDIQQIQFGPTDTYGGSVNAPAPWIATFQFANDFQISTGVTGDTPIDLGMVNVVNTTMSFLSANEPAGWPMPQNIPTLDWPTQFNSTGYWNCWSTSISSCSEVWTMNITQIQSILANATDTVNIAFNLDLTSIVYYQFTTASGTQAGNATEQYSGPCATLQLLNEGDQLIGLQFNYSTIGLTMTES